MVDEGLQIQPFNGFVEDFQEHPILNGNMDGFCGEDFPLNQSIEPYSRHFKTGFIDPRQVPLHRYLSIYIYNVYIQGGFSSGFINPIHVKNPPSYPKQFINKQLSYPAGLHKTPMVAAEEWLEARLQQHPSVHLYMGGDRKPFAFPDLLELVKHGQTLAA